MGGCRHKTIINCYMKYFVLVLGILCLLRCRALPEDFQANRMVFTQNQSYGEQRIDRIDRPTVIFSLTQLQFDGNFGLSIQSNIKRMGQAIDQISLRVGINNLGNKKQQIRVTVQYAIMRELPFLESIVFNMSSSSNHKEIQSAKRIVSNENVVLTAFCIGFTNIDITNNLYYTAVRGSTTYTVYTRSPFAPVDWLVVNLIILDSNPPKDLMCGGSYLVPVHNLTSASGPYIFQQRSNLEYIFGVESIFFHFGDMSYDPANFTVNIRERGAFDCTIIFLNPKCPSGKVQEQKPPDPTNQTHTKVFIVLTIVFATLFGVLVVCIILYFLLCFKRHAEMVARNDRSSQLPIYSLPESRAPSDVVSDKKSEKMESAISRPGLHSIVGIANPSVENRSEPQDPITDTRLVHVPRRPTYFYKSKIIINRQKRKPCTYPNCTNNPYINFPTASQVERKLCPLCAGGPQQIQEITQ